jgi:predicted transcriptional regulator
LPHRKFSTILKSVEVHFTPELETQLSQIANYAGTDAEGLVKDAALRLLQEEACFGAAVREGIAQADRGEFIEEEEMDARLSRCCAHRHAHPLDASLRSGLAEPLAITSKSTVHVTATQPCAKLYGTIRELKQWPERDRPGRGKAPERFCFLQCPMWRCTA